MLFVTVLNLFIHFFCRLFDSIDKIQIHTIFLFQFKLGRKAAETAHDINDAFGSGTNGDSKNFTMVTRAFKIKAVAAGRLQLITNIWKP